MTLRMKNGFDKGGTRFISFYYYGIEAVCDYQFTLFYYINYT